MMTIYNFAAGPATLPDQVLAQVQAELTNYQGTGLSILEISHRSVQFTTLLAQAKQLLLQLMNLTEREYEVLFLQGGATLQFTMVPLNLANKFHRVAFVNSGHWAERAMAEAKLIPDLAVEEIATSAPQFNHFPTVEFTGPAQYDYLHLTTNNTIFGTSLKQLPAANLPLVGDLSSNFLAQDYPFDHFDLIYAGAQKNLAPAGLTVVVVKKSLLSQMPTALPAMLSYRKLAAKDSTLNTPPVFQIYVAKLVLEWLVSQGGVSAMEAINRQKAQLIYEAIDQTNFYHNPVRPADGSLTNIPFTTGNSALDQTFITTAEQAGLKNLKGHRLTGGMRASLYNAMPLAGAVALRDFMLQFAKDHAEEK